MVRSWNQLVGSAVELWAVLPSAPNSPSWSDPMERLRAIGEAISRSVTAGHWPGQGPTEEHLTQIADNLSHAQHLVERSGRASQSTHGFAGRPPACSRPGDAHVVRGRTRDGCRTRRVRRGSTGTSRNCQAAAAASSRTANRPGDQRRAGHDRAVRRVRAPRGGGVLGRSEPPSSTNPAQAATPTKRLETALAAWEVQAHRTLAASPDPADLVRVARVQALITSTTSILTEAAAQKGHIDVDVIQRLAPSLEASQMAWSRMAKRWGELTNPASRTDPALVGAASEVRAAIAATATNQAGWATPDQLASRLDLPNIVKTLHLSMVASVEIAYVVRDTAADHPGLTAPARIIGMRSQGEAEIAIEQGETRYEGVTWTTRRQLASNQLIPLPEPARRGLINLADDVLATTNQAVAAGAQLDPSDVTRSTRSGQRAHLGRSVESHQITHPHDPAPRGPRR